jgi:hypothetical protein
MNLNKVFGSSAPKLSNRTSLVHKVKGIKQSNYRPGQAQRVPGV